MLPPWTSGTPDAARPWDRWDRAALAVAIAIGAWVFAVKLAAFRNLAFTSDLFVGVQLARSWLEGRFLEDNCFGRHLEIHTYFFLLPLGLLAKPFGAPGLFFALGAAVGATSFLSHRILRLYGVAGWIALVAGLALVTLPISIWFFGDADGFHVELMLPPLAVGLLYALLRGRLGGSLVMALLVASVKEEAPIAVAIVAVVVLVETRLAERRWHRPALAVLALAVVLLPLLLAIRRLQPHGLYAVDHFRILAKSSHGRIQGPWSLFGVVLANVGDWIRFTLDRDFARLFFVATLGMILFRPWAIPLGFVSTGIAWIFNVALLYPPRAAVVLVFWWCIILLGTGSLSRWLAALSPKRRARAATLAAVVGACSVLGQMPFVTAAADPLDLHLVRPGHYSPEERLQADQLFAVYRREARPQEPVAASPFLFRYAHDRNLYWLDRLEGRPRPIWILQDGSWPFTDYGLRAEDYTVLARNGRFTLLKRIVP